MHGAFALKAVELAGWLPTVFGQPLELTGSDKLNQLQGRTGILFLKSFQGIDTPSRYFNHIDLWNGYANRFGHGNSDWINRASRVLFWEIR